MAAMGAPVVLVPNGAPVSPGALGTPVTIVGGNGIVAIQDGETVPIEDGSGNSLGNATVTIVNGEVVVDWPGGGSGTPLEDGEPVNLDNHDGSVILASTTARVAAGNLVGVILPQNYAVIQDGIGNFDVSDFGAGGGDVAVIARVSNNQPDVQLANATTKIAVSAAPVQVTAGSKTVGATLAVDQGTWEPFPLSDASDAIVSNGDVVNVTDHRGAPVVSSPVQVDTHNLSAVTLPNTALIIVDGASMQIENQGATQNVSGSISLVAGVSTAKLPASSALVANNVDITVPVTGTYVDTITPTVSAAGAITGFTLS